MGVWEYGNVIKPKAQSPSASEAERRRLKPKTKRSTAYRQPFPHVRD